MNPTVFLDWLKKKVLPVVSPRSVLAFDRATYHTMLTDETKPAKSTYRKLEFANWLVEHDVQWEGKASVDEFMSLTRVELAAICKANKPKPIFLAATLAKSLIVRCFFCPWRTPS